MNKPSKKWLAEHAEEVLEGIGVEKNKKILDFGCGKGIYTIPAAKIVGKNGIVYAVDKDKHLLDYLIRKTQSEGLDNIEIIDTLGNLEDRSIDVVLLYDVLHHINDRNKLLKQIYRISKSNALISVYPHVHFENDEVKEIMEKANFYLENTYKNCILNFRKK